MCIIVFKPKGADIPSDAIIKNCFKINSDGAGFMFADSGAVKIRKGYMTAGGLLDALKYYQSIYNLKDKNLILHFRIGTSGGLTSQKCHPFPLTDKVAELNALKIDAACGVVHNGVLSDYVYGDLSDTQNYIRDLLKPLDTISGGLNLEDENTKRIIKATLGSCKLLLLDKNDNVLRLGEWCEDAGVFYSNLTYKTSYYTSSTKEDTDYNYTKYYNYNFYNYSSASGSAKKDYTYNQDLFDDITESLNYKMIPNQAGINVYDFYNLAEEIKQDYFTDLFIDASGYVYRVDWEYQSADYLGRARLFDEDGNEYHWSDLKA